MTSLYNTNLVPNAAALEILKVGNILVTSAVLGLLLNAILGATHTIEVFRRGESVEIMYKNGMTSTEIRSIDVPSKVIACTALIFWDDAVFATRGCRSRTILDACASIGKSLVNHLIDPGLES